MLRSTKVKLPQNSFPKVEHSALVGLEMSLGVLKINKQKSQLNRVRRPEGGALLPFYDS